MLRTCLTCCLLNVALTGAASGADITTTLVLDSSGTRIETVTSPSETRPEGESNRASDDGNDVIWHRTFSDATYTTTDISSAEHRLFAGTYLNPPKETELIPLDGDGTPDWVFPGTHFKVSAARDSDALATVDYSSGDQKATVIKWHADSSVPDWTYAIAPCTMAGGRTIAVSEDGSTIAVIVTIQAAENYARAYLFDAASSTLLGSYDAPAGTFARNLDITDDGAYIAFVAGTLVVVVDRDADAIRGTVDMGASTEPVAISNDGNTIAYGWTRLYVREWNGSDYVIVWSLHGGLFSLRSCNFSSDGGTFGAAWYRNTFLQNRLQLFDPSSSSPIWTYDYTPGAGSYQDIPTDVELTADGSYIVVGSWGDQLNTNPEVHVFSRDIPYPLMTVDTPGSVFDVDIAAGDGTEAYVTACGKHIHANENGRGGDLYSIRIDGPVTVGDGPMGPAAAISLAARPNPLRGFGTLELRLADPTTGQVAIYAPSGTLVRRLASGALDAGTHTFHWDGRNTIGRIAAPGVYLLQAETAAGVAADRIILLR